MDQEARLIEELNVAMPAWRDHFEDLDEAADAILGHGHRQDEIEYDRPLNFDNDNAGFDQEWER
jgi:hypothetical protein